MIVIPKDEAYESVRNRVWYPPACENKEEHIKFLFKGCQEMDIVFCKDCRYRNGKVNRKGFEVCDATRMDITDEDFCSWGERREE